MNAPLVAAMAAMLLVLAACGLPANMVILIPDENGHTGTAIVTGGGTAVQLDRPFSGAETAPGHPAAAITSLTQARVDREFAAALAATPRQPLVFRVYFATAQAALDARAEAVLATAVAAAKGLPNLDVGIVGYTDAIGHNADANGPLSRHRAEAVRKRLVDAGIPADMIAIAWFGAENPAVPNRPGVSEPLNRRVEIILR